MSARLDYQKWETFFRIPAKKGRTRTARLNEVIRSLKADSREAVHKMTFRCLIWRDGYRAWPHESHRPICLNFAEWSIEVCRSKNRSNFNIRTGQDDKVLKIWWALLGSNQRPT